MKRMKRKTAAWLALALVLAGGGILGWRWSHGSSAMVPAQGYIALGQGMEAQLPLTCYYRGKAPFEPGRVVSAWLESRDGRQMGAAGIQIRRSKARWGQPRLELMLTLAPQEQGVFQAQTLVLWTDDGRQGRYPIGSWTVDVGQPPPERPLLQDQGIRVISTDTPQLPYDYDLAKGAKLLSVQVGPGQVHSVVRSGVDRTSGRLPLQGDAQLFYIKPKLLVEAEGRIQAQYGLSTYCFCGEAEPRLLPNQSFWQQG